MKKYFLVITIIAVVAGVAAFIIYNQDPVKKLQSTLNSKGFQTEIKDATFQGHSSKKISAAKDTRQVDIQIVENVNQNDSPSIQEGLTTPVTYIEQKFVVTDPYSGKKSELTVPTELQPVKKDMTIAGQGITYYTVWANEILSLKIFSKSEASMKGILSVYYCPKISQALRVEIFDPIDKFNEQDALSLFSDLYCK